MLSNGAITETGTYEELKAKEGAFAEFIQIYLANNEINKMVFGKRASFLV